MAKYRVLVTDYTWESTALEAEVLARVGAELVIAETGKEEELARLVADVDAICIAGDREGSALDAEAAGDAQVRKGEPEDAAETIIGNQ